MTSFKDKTTSIDSAVTTGERLTKHTHTHTRRERERDIERCKSNSERTLILYRLFQTEKTEIFTTVKEQPERKLTENIRVIIIFKPSVAH